MSQAEPSFLVYVTDWHQGKIPTRTCVEQSKLQTLVTRCIGQQIGEIREVNHRNLDWRVYDHEYGKIAIGFREERPVEAQVKATPAKLSELTFLLGMPYDLEGGMIGTEQTSAIFIAA